MLLRCTTLRWQVKGKAEGVKIPVVILPTNKHSSETLYVSSRRLDSYTYLLTYLLTYLFAFVEEKILRVLQFAFSVHCVAPRYALWFCRTKCKLLRKFNKLKTNTTMR